MTADEFAQQHQGDYWANAQSVRKLLEQSSTLMAEVADPVRLPDDRMARSSTGETAATKPPRYAEHMPALDGVRGLAILAVLLFHFVGQTVVTNRFEAAVNRVLNYGSLGRDLFFVLSGFLITGMLYDARGREHYFRNFYSVAAAAYGASVVTTTVLTPFQLDALFLGGLFAVWLRQPGGEAAVRRLLAPLAAVGVIVAGLTYLVPSAAEAGRAASLEVRGGVFRVLFAVLLLAALLASSRSVVGSFFRSRPMAFLEKYSYGLYVYHHFASYYMMSHRTEFAVAQSIGCKRPVITALRSAVGGACVTSCPTCSRSFEAGSVGGATVETIGIEVRPHPLKE